MSKKGSSTSSRGKGSSESKTLKETYGSKASNSTPPSNGGGTVSATHKKNFGSAPPNSPPPSKPKTDTNSSSK